MLAFIGLGLYGIRDISLGALSFLRRANKIFVEYYTSLLPSFDAKKLEIFLKRNIEIVTRKQLEEESGSKILEAAKKYDVALLIPGNPFVATTHISLRIEAEKKGIRTLVYPAPSILDGIIIATGLQSYKMGRIVTIVYPDESLGYWPLTPYEVLKENLRLGLHTLFLLDIKASEAKYMTVKEGLNILLETENKVKGNLLKDSVVIGIARATAPDQKVLVGDINTLLNADLGPPPHSIVIPSLLHPEEIEALKILGNAKEEVLKRWNLRVKRELRFT